MRQQHNYWDLQYERVSETYGNYFRIKRGSDWDESNSDYNIIASYYTRRSDVSNYPDHKAYIYARSFSAGSLGMSVGVGAFSGMAISSQSLSYKHFAKAAANIELFGRTYSLASLEISRYTYATMLYEKRYLKWGSSTLRNDDSKMSAQCKKTTSNYDSYTAEIF